jgi:tetratricopeptide (TPR) repeat protein
LLATLCDSFPRESAHQVDLALARCALAPLQNAGEAIEDLRSAVARLEALVVTGEDGPPERESALGRCFLALGERLAESDKLEEAAKSYRQALSIFEKLASARVQWFAYHRQLALAWGGLAEVYFRRGDLVEANDALDRAVECENVALAFGSRKHKTNRSVMRDGLMVMILMRQGRTQEAAATARELVQYEHDCAASAYRAARRLAQCIGVSQEPQPKGAERETPFDFAKGAIQKLALAVKLGLKDSTILEIETDFTAIHDHPGFVNIVKQLATKGSQSE